jgi:hypothetical protein
MIAIRGRGLIRSLVQRESAAPAIGVSYPAIVRVLLDRGAVPDDHDLYLACFGDDDHESLRLLLERMPNIAETTALAAPISTGDTEGCCWPPEPTHVAPHRPSCTAPARRTGRTGHRRTRRFRPTALSSWCDCCSRPALTRRRKVRMAARRASSPRDTAAPT